MNWLTHLPGAGDILQQISTREISYSKALRTLNENVRQDYDRILAEYDQLEAAYRRRYKIFSPAQDRLTKITDLVTHKNTIAADTGLQPVEKYARLLGALKAAHDNVLALHIMGREDHRNGALTQFFKRHLTDSDLATELAASLQHSAPSIVTRSFFGSTARLDAPILTTAQSLARII